MERLAEGREADVFALDQHRVLRRHRRGQSVPWEARLNIHLRAHGFPTPAVLDVAGADTIYARVHGPSMLEDLSRRPRRAIQHARTLSRLHAHLHLIAPPHYLPRVGDGNSLLHLDLHPGNVLLGPDGPWVIDWPNAVAGHAGQDLAVSWVLLRTASAPTSKPVEGVAGVGRELFLRAFLRGADRKEARRHLAFATSYRLRDRNLAPHEQVAIQRLIRREAPRRGR